MENSKINIQFGNTEEILLGTFSLPITIENQQFIVNQYDVRSTVDARISILVPCAVFSPQFSSTINPSMMPQHGESMQIDPENSVKTFPTFLFHYNKGTSTHDMYVHPPTTYQNRSSNTFTPTTVARGTSPDVLEGSLNQIKHLNAQEMIKNRKKMFIQ
uniref:Uncharacterized protein n=1 Tax=Lutzomyia longipalpis TaxID=7200 RepID=A0A1B0CNK0_LUTLO